jgi:hypothetical protein
MGTTDGGPAEGAGHDPATWLADYSARWVRTAQESLNAGATAAGHWGRRSLDEGDDWSMDTVMADVIADWEELTPLLGRWLDLWLEAVQQGIKGGRPRGG